MERKTVDIILLLFTLVTVCIALLLLVIVLLKNKCCPQKSIYANTENFNRLPDPKQLSITPKMPLRNGEAYSFSLDLGDLEFIDEKSAHLIPSSITIDSLHNVPFPA